MRDRRWGRFLEVLMLGALSVWLAGSVLHAAGLGVALPHLLLAAAALPLPLAVWLAARPAPAGRLRRLVIRRARRARRVRGRAVLTRRAWRRRALRELRPGAASGRADR